jgi:hypothetical protein
LLFIFIISKNISTQETLVFFDGVVETEDCPPTACGCTMDAPLLVFIDDVAELFELIVLVFTG